MSLQEVIILILSFNEIVYKSLIDFGTVVSFRRFDLYTGLSGRVFGGLPR